VAKSAKAAAGIVLPEIGLPESALTASAAATTGVLVETAATGAKAVPAAGVRSN
jgi:hypothetical protein